MGWKERLLPASFRGVSFYVNAANNTFGRRMITHEFPQRDVPYTEDLGRQPKHYQIDGYLLGDMYMEQRDRLQSACEDQSTAGELIHPYYGILKVLCSRFVTLDSTEETRILRIQIAFVEAGSLLFPSTFVNTSFSNATNKLSVIDQARAGLRALYDLTRIPVNKFREIRTNVQSAIGAIEDYRLIVASVASYGKMVKRTLADIDTLIQSADDLAEAMADLVTFGSFPDGLFPSDRNDFDTANEENPATELNSRDQFDELKSMFEWEPETSTSEQSDAVTAYIQQINIATGAGFMSVMPFSSLDDAEAFQDIIVGQINRVLLNDLPTDIAAAFRDLKASVIADLKKRATTLARLTTLTPPESVPALVLSFKLYGTVDAEQDIIDRNKIDHPGFIPGGQEIEVLTSV